VQEFITTRQGYRLATSTGGVLTGRGADIILIDDPLKPEEALSEAQRQAANDGAVPLVIEPAVEGVVVPLVMVMQRQGQQITFLAVIDLHLGMMRAIGEVQDAPVIADIASNDDLLTARSAISASCSTPVSATP
jgi:hypothetical protein